MVSFNIQLWKLLPIPIHFEHKVGGIIFRNLTQNAWWKRANEKAMPEVLRGF